MVRRSVVVFDQQEGCLGRLNGGRGASAPRQHFGVCVLGRPWVESMLIADARGGVFWCGCFDCRDSWEIVGWGGSRAEDGENWDGERIFDGKSWQAFKLPEPVREGERERHCLTAFCFRRLPLPSCVSAAFAC